MRSRSHVIKPDFFSTHPTISHGKDIYLYDKDGKEYIDGSSGAVTANIGHAVEEIAEAMYEQAKRVSFAFRNHFNSEVTEELGYKLAQWAPGTLNWCFFVNSGSEATEMAQKIAIQYWQERGFANKNRVISRWMSYHGNTMGALSMSGHVPRRKLFTQVLADYPTIQPPYYYRYGEGRSPEEFALQCANELEVAIHRVGPENVAAFIAEPVIGATGGAIVPPPGYFQRIREICDEYDVLFIVDEVMTGMGRTGKNFGIDHWGVNPDLMALGKGMSAGYTPMAATVVTDEIIEVVSKGSGALNPGHTYSANPQSAATALAVVNYVEKNNLVDNASKMGEYLISQLNGLMDQCQIVGDSRGLGLLCALEFVKDKSTKATYPLSLGVTQRIIKKCFENGLIVYPAAGCIDGRAGDAILISPPLIVTKDEIDRIIAILSDAITEVENEL